MKYKTILRVWTISILCIVIGLISVVYTMYTLGVDTWKKQASAYNTKNPYVISNYMQVIRELLLASGMQDTSALYQLAENVHHKAYLNGIAEIPADDGERYIWEYRYHIAPYIENAQPTQNVKDIRKRLNLAISYAMHMPAAHMKNAYMDKHARFEAAYYSLSFIGEHNDHMEKASLPKDGLAIIVSHAIPLIASVKPKDLKTTHQKGLYALYNIKILQLSAFNLVDSWPHLNQPCTNMRVTNYVAIRTHIKTILRPLLTNEEAALLNMHRISSDITPADQLLSEQCKILIPKDA